jgi:hypothetical protein
MEIIARNMIINKECKTRKWRIKLCQSSLSVLAFLTWDARGILSTLFIRREVTIRGPNVILHFECFPILHNISGVCPFARHRHQLSPRSDSAQPCSLMLFVLADHTWREWIDIVLGKNHDGLSQRTYRSLMTHKSPVAWQLNWKLHRRLCSGLRWIVCKGGVSKENEWWQKRWVFFRCSALNEVNGASNQEPQRLWCSASDYSHPLQRALRCLLLWNPYRSKANCEKLQCVAMVPLMEFELSASNW